ncbi:hypothetical protein ACFY3V_32670 [Streptosporangium sp. NPDC000095]|uniref:hypothetical protein n=1 Tax=Streptosporangium sp. NPDC000095 TaxID=3366184 RepID=UPI0036CC3CA9
MTEVLVTDTGERYHASECWALRAGQQGGEALGFDIHRIRSVSVADAEAEGKTPCKVCVAR